MSLRTIKMPNKETKKELWNELYDKFMKLSVERFYLKIKNNFFKQAIDKETIIKLFKNMMTAKCVKHVREVSDQNKAATNNNMNQMLLHTRYYTRNEEPNEMNLEVKFIDPYFWNRVNEIFASQSCYQINKNK